MSMGGYGALHLGMKHPTLFGAISSVAPSILQDLKDEPKERTFDTFFDDEADYDANGPWTLARENAAALRRGCAIRCTRCGKRTSIIAFVTDQAAIGRTLDHLGLSTPETAKPPPCAPEVLRVAEHGDGWGVPAEWE
jgi:hypothetical protein